MLLVKYMSEIYKPETIEYLHRHGSGWDETTKEFTVTEVIAQLGKGSGKDYCSTIAVARIVYLLLCLKDPSGYYDLAPESSVDILNIAINAKQAANVFFKELKKRFRRSPWFQGKFETAGAGEPKRQDEFNFIKNVNCFSGHSERESWEGYNFIAVILDEISGFAVDNSSGHAQAKTAAAIYDMYKNSVLSRFPDYGKTILLSFPRYKDDFIQQRYNEVILDKEVEICRKTVKLNPELPDGIPANEYEVVWERDHIVRYKMPRVYARRRPSWEVNPHRTVESYTEGWFRNPQDTLMRFACMPPEAVDAFFTDHEALHEAFPELPSPLYEDGTFAQWFKPGNFDYYIHCDLAYKSDRAAVAMAHCEEWTKLQVGNMSIEVPVITIDVIKYWTPGEQTEGKIDLADVQNFILSIRARGFKIKLVTFDKWGGSVQTMNNIQGMGMNTEILSVNKAEYEELRLAAQDRRLHGYYDEILWEELVGLRLIKGDRVDHPRKGSNDLADAVAGAVFNVVKYASKPTTELVDFRPLGATAPKPELKEPVRTKPSSAPPPDIAEYLARIRML